MFNLYVECLKLLYSRYILTITFFNAECLNETRLTVRFFGIFVISKIWPEANKSLIGNVISKEKHYSTVQYVITCH